MALELVEIIDQAEAGRRLRRLRLLADLTQGELGRGLDYAVTERGSCAQISKIEKGERSLDDARRRRAANVLAGKGELVFDARALLGYLLGDHSSLDQCVAPTGFGSRGSPGRDRLPITIPLAKTA